LRRHANLDVFAVTMTFLGLASAADAAVHVASALADATIYGDPGTQLANGAGQYLTVGRTNTGMLRRGLLRFDLAGLPTDATIVSVTMRLHLSQAQAGSFDLALHRALASWSEGPSDPPGGEGGGVPAVAGDVTWNYRDFDTLAWSVSGGDFVASASATATVGTAVGWYEWTGPGLAADLAAYLADSRLDFGWFLIGDETVNQSTRRFDSRHAELGFRPELVVTWVPAPAALPAMLAGAAAVARRRRR